MQNIKEKYQKEVIPTLKEKFGYKNNLAVPRIIKVVINTGFNPANRDKKAQGEIAEDLSAITGQKLVPCISKISEAGFKIRKGMTVGLKATLRGPKMYDFLDRLVNIALPRCRDFRGLPEKNIDQGGNLNIGIKEHIVFPEISTESAKNIFGFEISITTTAKTQEEGLELFKLLKFPIRIDKKKK
ncbi:MAG: 50S ribosomal protein L5 [Patescibacteria group bacterium]